MQETFLKAICDLKDCIFFIPSYQRGYRWEERDVALLVEDIWDFANLEDKSNEDFYCLQPIVIKQEKQRWRVIDGQQRLTTLFLIIRFLTNQSFFKIEYQTRKDSFEFLNNIEKNIEQQDLNIDFFHFVSAYKTIKAVFNEKNIETKAFLAVLMNEVKVLWYETKEKENEVFVRLNVGKIPLLEAENIKALFLTSSNKDVSTQELRKRADFWYKTEKKAREENDFRYCVLSKVSDKDIDHDKQGRPSLKDDILRIEVYLKAIVPYSTKHYYLFDYFYQAYKNNKLSALWDDFKNCVNNLQSLTSTDRNNKESREIFHYLGFLTLHGEKIYDIYKLWLKNQSKQMFNKELFNRVSNKMKTIIPLLDGGLGETLNYHIQEDKKKIFLILLLFNLEYLIRDESNNKYFEFNRFVLEQWSLEHIYAQNSKSILDAIKQQNGEVINKWLDEVLQYADGYAENLELVQKIKDFRQEDYSLKSKQDMQEFFEFLDKSFKDSDSLNTISNLTLLDKSSNSAFGNLIFSQKRKKIDELARQDKLIPIMTRKVFDKSIEGLDISTKDFFSRSDRTAYYQYIINLISRYRVTL